MDERIKAEYCAAVEGMIKTIAFYFNKYPDNRHEWAQSFKENFCELVDRMEKDFEEGEEGFLRFFF